MPRRVASAGHLVAVGVILALRGDLPPAGWVSAVVASTAVPALWIAIWPSGVLARIGGLPMAALSVLAAVWSAVAPGPGVTMWTQWAVPHIALSIIGLGAALGAALVAVRGLRGRAGLLVVALLLSAAPLLSPKAASVHAHVEGQPASMDVTIADPVGDQGLVRTLAVRVPLPGERPMRFIAIAGLLLGLLLAIARIPAGRLRWLVVVGVAAHAAWLASAMAPRDLGVDEGALTDYATHTLVPELSAVQDLGTVAVPVGALTGGLGAPALPLSLALLALGLTLVAMAANPGDDSDRRRATDRVERLLVTIACVGLAAGAAFGMVWSNYRWGGPIVADPKVFATAIALGVFGLYFLAKNTVAEDSPLPHWAVLFAAAVLLLSVLGPELGWTAPTLHYFGA